VRVERAVLGDALNPGPHDAAVAVGDADTGAEAGTGREVPPLAAGGVVAEAALLGEGAAAPEALDVAPQAGSATAHAAAATTQRADARDRTRMLITSGGGGDRRATAVARIAPARAWSGRVTPRRG
jgi:hypothetical protein